MRQMFKNGFGVSVITDGYGEDEGLLELAVITEDGLHYENDVADGDVCGYLTQEDVDFKTMLVSNFATYVADDDIYYYGDGSTKGKDQE